MNPVIEQRPVDGPDVRAGAGRTPSNQHAATHCFETVDEVLGYLWHMRDHPSEVLDQDPPNDPTLPTLSPRLKNSFPFFGNEWLKSGGIGEFTGGGVNGLR